MAYNLIDWHLQYSADVVRARPSSSNVLHRLKITGVMAVLVCIAPIFSLPSRRAISQALREPVPSLSERVTHPVMLTIYGFFAAIGLVAPLTAIWQRTRIRLDGRGDVMISTFLFWPRRQRIAKSTIKNMSVVATEERTLTDEGDRCRRWRWRVLLESTGGKTEFVLCESMFEPDLTGVPRRVVEFVQALEIMTGVEYLQLQESL